MWPYYGHFQIHDSFWPLDHIKNHLTWLAIANCEDYNFKIRVEVGK